MGISLRLLRWTVLAGALLALAACSSARERLGIGALTPPDEFTVVTKAPLVLPPDFGLRPPAPGAPRPQAQDPQRPAGASLLNAGEGAAAAADPAAAARTEGEDALLAAARTDEADPGIRAVIQLEAQQIAERGRGFAERVIFWQENEGPDAVLNAVAEAERLRQAGVTNLPPNIGQPEARRTGGLLAF